MVEELRLYEESSGYNIWNSDVKDSEERLITRVENTIEEYGGKLLESGSLVSYEDSLRGKIKIEHQLYEIPYHGVLDLRKWRKKDRKIDGRDGWSDLVKLDAILAGFGKRDKVTEKLKMTLEDTVSDVLAKLTLEEGNL